jgi:hypothetical protein
MDLSALTYLHKFADNNSTLMHWRLRFAEFDFEVEHRAGTQIRHVGAFKPTCANRGNRSNPL